MNGCHSSFVNSRGTGNAPSIFVEPGLAAGLRLEREPILSCLCSLLPSGTPPLSGSPFRAWHSSSAHLLPGPCTLNSPRHSLGLHTLIFHSPPHAPRPSLAVVYLEGPEPGFSFCLRRGKAIGISQISPEYRSRVPVTVPLWRLRA